jgi:hypothetical protein
MELIQGANCRALAFKLNNLISYALTHPLIYTNTHTHTHAHVYTELKPKEKLQQGHIGVATIG